MTIFAGIFPRYPNKEIPQSFRASLRSVLSRFPDDKNAIIEYCNDNIYLAKVDIGVLDGPGHFTDPAMIGFVAGDPLLQTNHEMAASRLESLKLLAYDLKNKKQNSLCKCRGTYCAVIYERENHKLYLITDKLGIRPVYFWVLPDFIFFATALRILESLSLYQKEMDLTGIAEIACFAYPLADRTPYKNIFTLYAGEVTCFVADKIKREKYWVWDDLPAKGNSSGQFPKHLHNIFVDSVKIRLRNQPVAAAFLSGGLDSRAIVATLRDLNVEVITANFASLGSQDQVFGQLAADKLGTKHTHLLKGKANDRDAYHKNSVKEWLSSAEDLSQVSLQPKVIWSGDGGSVGLGHVYLNSEIIQAARRKDLKIAIQQFFSHNNWGLSLKLLKSQLASQVRTRFEQGIKVEIDTFDPEDPGRIFYLFLLLNDQRRHMFNHFENMDLERIEFELPFFDANFIAEIIQQPIDNFLRHVFYLEWLNCFKSKVLEIPWQAYPGHVPCPLSLPEGLKYQWESTQENKKQNILWALQSAKALSQDPEFMSSYINKYYFQLWLLLQKYGKFDRSYLIQLPVNLYRYWIKTHVQGKN